MSAIESCLDHIVIVTDVLGDGVDFCEKTLGVNMTKGGEHVRVGTHNYVLNLGEGIYLEVIAINPQAGTLSCPRWFGMDLPERRERAARGPYVATFVARTREILGAVKELPELGPVRDMQRGALEWQITIPDDGGLLEDGTVPTVIQWPHGIHPTQNLPLSGCRLERLEVFHPDPPRLRTIWARIGLMENEKLRIREAQHDESSFLLASIATPKVISEDEYPIGVVRTGCDARGPPRCATSAVWRATQTRSNAAARPYAPRQWDIHPRKSPNGIITLR